jgi:AcrR family transcriptional regulator
VPALDRNRVPQRTEISGETLQERQNRCCRGDFSASASIHESESMARRSLARPTPTAPRRAPTQPRARVTRDAILIAAERVLERHGIAGLNTNRVAEIAGVSIGSVYQYYPNKEALIAALIERNTAQVVDQVRGVLAQHASAPPEVVAVAVGFAIQDAFRSQAKVHLALFEHLSSLGMVRPYEDALAQITEVVAEWIAGNPSLVVDDPRTTAWVIVRAVEGVIRAQSLAVHSIDENAAMRETATMLVRHFRRAG